MALTHGRPQLYSNVYAVDPRMEFQEVPKPQGHAPKSPSPYFLGDITFSLPVQDEHGRNMWLVGARDANLGSFLGQGYLSPQPEGVVVNKPNWADKAIIMTEEGDFDNGRQ